MKKFTGCNKSRTDTAKEKKSINFKIQQLKLFKMKHEEKKDKKMNRASLTFMTILGGLTYV